MKKHKFSVKWILIIPPHHAYFATLHCETLVSANQTINDKLQDSVATYLTYGGDRGLLITTVRKFYC